MRPPADPEAERAEILRRIEADAKHQASLHAELRPHVLAALDAADIAPDSAAGRYALASAPDAAYLVRRLTRMAIEDIDVIDCRERAIAPGFIETEMTQATAARMGVDFEEFKKFSAAQIPVARVGVPEDIAHTASFFASEGAGFVSGQVVYVAGGPKD